jgi:glycosyltransferase involved in cell wall biosynthesis
MRILFVADSYPPLRNSAAVQVKDLTSEFISLNNQVTVLAPNPSLKEPLSVVESEGAKVIFIRVLQARDSSYFKRTVAEILMPLIMIYRLKRSRILNGKDFEALIWYSPSIFFGPLIRYLQNLLQCKTYLIVRDIFPDWALDIGLMRKSLPYYFFKLVAAYQYSLADVIGVQSEGNKKYFTKWQSKQSRSLEVLQNWYSKKPFNTSSISIENSSLAGRKIFVYAGNMGIAQGMESLLYLAERMSSNDEAGFVFVGRGAKVKNLKKYAEAKNLKNILFFDEIDPSEISDLYDQCHIGLIALAPGHKSHNIPGKFLSYMNNGLPVLACVNAGNDLIHLIQSAKVGAVISDNNLDSLEYEAHILLNQLASHFDYKNNCLTLSQDLFSSNIAALQILRAVKK